MTGQRKDEDNLPLVQFVIDEGQAKGSRGKEE